MDTEIAGVDLAVSGHAIPWANAIQSPDLSGGFLLVI